jgi:gamma-glutamyl:cysteine ligase YbdK (ATP-grasp superfamily)
VPEVCKPSLEINSNYCNLEKDALRQSKENLEMYWQLCEKHARKHQLYAIHIGTLPNASAEEFSKSTLTNLKRYTLMNDILLNYRHFSPIHLNISSKDSLDIYREDMALMGATAAFQIHLRVGLDESIRYYNASLLLAAPLLAISNNSAFLLQKQLWSETRIPLFEQTLNFYDKDHVYPRVSLGRGYLSHSFMELFEENLFFPPLITCKNSMQINSSLLHLRLHNGAIHRWFRPIVDVTDVNNPHLRIENRIMPAGPTIEDMLANTALFLGSVEFFANHSIPPQEFLPFIEAKKNFYMAAKYGLDATLRWQNHQKIAADVLIDKFILPAAEQGLKQLNINASDITHYLGIIRQRIKKHKTGSIWQQEFIQKNPAKFDQLVEKYLELQHKGKPVHRW